MEKQVHEARYKTTDFLPLISLFSLIITIVIAHQYHYGLNADEAMRIAMASFFLIFGFFKVINLRGFAQAYSKYDLIAKKYMWYGYIYPLIEVGIGTAYLFTWNLFQVNIATLALMLVSAAGVFKQLSSGKQITCACLGAVFKVPMTYVTLLEDLLMAAMALVMLF